jgi:PAS domain S-box-containing protein
LKEQEDIRRREQPAAARPPRSRASTKGGAALRRRFEELETLYRTAPVGLCAVDTDLRFIRINDRLAEIDGVSVEDHLGRTIQEVVPGLAPLIVPVYEEVLRTGNPALGIEIHGDAPTSTGEQRVWSATYHPIRDDRGRILGVSGVVQDITELKHREQQLHERAEFEALVADLSAEFVGTPVEGLDRLIQHSLARLGEFMRADRSFLNLFSDDQSTFTLAHMWFADGVPRDDPMLRAPVHQQLPWLTRRMLDREPLVLRHPDEFPPEAEAERNYVISRGLGAGMLLPIVVGETVLGNIGIDSISPREWPEEQIGRLELIGQVFGNALARRRHRQEVERFAAFEALVTELAADFVDVPGAKIDARMDHWLGRLGEFLDLDLCTVMQLDLDSGRLKHSHQWLASGELPDPGFLEFDIEGGAPWFVSQLRSMQVAPMSAIRGLPAEAALEWEVMRSRGIQSTLGVPFAVGGEFRGAIVINTMRDDRKWSDAYVRRIQLVGEVFGAAVVRRRAEAELRRALGEIEELKDRLEAENVALREHTSQNHDFEEIVGRSEPLRHVLEQVDQVARTDATVLIQGETGTGKELIARAIHTRGSRNGRPFVKVNCAAIPDTLLESEFFGHERGAFTGALQRKIGRFEMANGGTILLDEIGDLALELQAKLLRVLQDGEFERLGSTRTTRVDVRVLAATNRDLKAAASDGRFRQDLFYRLSVFPIDVPPLRDRKDDIPLLVLHFIEKIQRRVGKRVRQVPKPVMDALKGHDWPGNVRELENAIEHALILSEGSTLRLAAPFDAGVATQTESSRLDDVERAHILRVLEECNWKVAGKGNTADRLGMNRSTLRYRIKKLGITRS